MKISHLGVFFTLPFALFLMACQASSPETTTTESTTTAPQVNTDSIRLIDYETLIQELEQHPDKLYIINLWATWCKPCVKELPYFQKVQKEFGEKVEVLFLSVDVPSIRKSKVEPFIQKKNIEERVLLLMGKPNVWIDQFDPEWQGDIPATLFFYPAKQQRIFKARTYEYNDLEEEVNRLLAQD